MPYTLAHPAAILPIWSSSRNRLRFAALAIGATTPDFEYFRHLNTTGPSFSHTLPGLFLICLPAGWLALLLFDRFGRQGVARLLPSPWRLPPPIVVRNPLLWTTVALLIGATTHLLWDAFTHDFGWGVEAFPQLLQPITLGPLSAPWFKVLQHGGTLLGLAVLGVAIGRWARRQPQVPIGELARRLIPVLAVLAAAGVLNGLRFLPQSFKAFIVAGGVAVTLAFALGPLLIGLIPTQSRVSAE